MHVRSLVLDGFAFVRGGAKRRPPPAAAAGSSSGSDRRKESKQPLLADGRESKRDKKEGKEGKRGKGSGGKPSKSGKEVIGPTFFRPFLAHFFSVFPRFWRVFTALPRRRRWRKSGGETT